MRRRRVQAPSASIKASPSRSQTCTRKIPDRRQGHRCWAFESILCSLLRVQLHAYKVRVSGVHRLMMRRVSSCKSGSLRQHTWNPERKTRARRMPFLLLSISCFLMSSLPFMSDTLRKRKAKMLFKCSKRYIVEKRTRNGAVPSNQKPRERWFDVESPLALPFGSRGLAEDCGNSAPSPDSRSGSLFSSLPLLLH